MALRSANDKPDEALDVRTDDVVAALLKRNPGFSRARVEPTARLMAALGATMQRVDAGSWTTGALQAPVLAILKQAVAEAVGAARDETPAEPVSRVKRSPRRLVLPVARAIEAGDGTGLGERISLEEGRRRVSDYAVPLALEEWAGPVAGPTELAARLGIARSTLQDWRRDGAAIGLLKGTRKHVFPLAQFVDGRPAPGIAETVEIVGEPRTAWLWLVEPRRNGVSPIEDLKHGRMDAVLDAAREDFA